MAEVPAIGIDFGASKSSVAVVVNGKVVVIPDERENKTIATCIASNNYGYVVGNYAKFQWEENPENTILSFKRLIAGNLRDTIPSIDAQNASYSVKCDDDQNPLIQMDCLGEMKELYPEECAAMVIRKLKHMAESSIGKTVQNTVITVPVAFDCFQRQAIRNAAKMAGLNVLRVIHDTTAAAIPYGLDKKGERNILVFDHGAQYLSVSILTIEDGLMEVKSTAGDHGIGGDRFDQRMIIHLSDEFKRRDKIDFNKDKVAYSRLLAACESAKRELQTYSEAIIKFEAFMGRVLLEKTISKYEFEFACVGLFDDCLQTIDKALKEAKMETKNIDDVVMIGGSSLIPWIEELISNHFSGKKLIFPGKTNPTDDFVVRGAAIQAAILSGDKSEFLQNVFLFDATNNTIGVEVAGKIMQTVIKKNTTFPIKTTRTFTTDSNRQKSVLIQIFEGDQAMTKDNRFLGKLEIDGIEPNQRGVPQIEVSFDIDVNGFLTVSAVDKTGGKTGSVRIVSDKKCTPEENIGKQIVVYRKNSDN